MGETPMNTFYAKRAFVVFGVAFILFVGCAQTRQFTPVPAPVRFQLEGLPANILEVHVNDLRGQSNEPDSAPQVLKAQIVNSLSTQPTPSGETRYAFAHSAC